MEDIMNLTGLVPSVSYSDYLEKSIDIWKANLNRVLVITTPTDHATIELAICNGCDLFETNVFFEKGAMFNKGAAIAQGFQHLEQHANAEHCDPLDWILFFDADVIPPKNIREMIEEAQPKKGKLYGAHRLDENSQRIPDNQVAGYFFLFHISDANVQQRPVVDIHWNNASAYDTTFEERWKSRDKIFLPIELIHQGPVNTNWCGRGNDESMQKLLAMRKHRGGWRHEKIDQ